MQTDTIDEVGIGDDGLLWVRPSAVAFPYVYREAMDVHWDAVRLRLHGSRPREWSYVRWYRQIIDAAREQGIRLILGPTTSLQNIEDELRYKIIVEAERLSVDREP